MIEPTSAWDTHLPALLLACEHTTGALVEFGMGDGSTPALHEFALARARRLDSYDHDAAWIERFRHLKHPYHHLHRVESWDAPPLPGGDFGVVLVDHGHAPRGPLVELVRARAQVVVLHDSECHYCGYGPVLAAFDWCYTCERWSTWTTLAGMGSRPAWVEPALQPGRWGIPVSYRG